MSDDNGERINAKYPRSGYFVSFGKFIRGEYARNFTHDHHIGRTEQRAKLINALLGNESRATILVTGSRGMGKSSFVDYCVRSAQRSLLRLLAEPKDNYGFGSYILFVLFLTASLFLYIVAADFAKLLYLQIINEPKFEFNFNFLLFIALNLFILSPLIYASKILNIGRFYIKLAILILPYFFVLCNYFVINGKMFQLILLNRINMFSYILDNRFGYQLNNIINYIFYDIIIYLGNFIFLFIIFIKNSLTPLIKIINGDILFYEHKYIPILNGLNFFIIFIATYFSLYLIIKAILDSFKYHAEWLNNFFGLLITTIIFIIMSLHFNGLETINLNEIYYYKAYPALILSVIILFLFIYFQFKNSLGKAREDKDGFKLYNKIIKKNRNYLEFFLIFILIFPFFFALNNLDFFSILLSLAMFIGLIVFIFLMVIRCFNDQSRIPIIFPSGSILTFKAIFCVLLPIFTLYIYFLTPKADIQQIATSMFQWNEFAQLILLFITIGTIFYFLEYRFIVAQARNFYDDESMTDKMLVDPSLKTKYSNPDYNYLDDRINDFEQDVYKIRDKYINLIPYTFAYQIYVYLNPIISCKISLGFENINSTFIIRSMLETLRERIGQYANIRTSFAVVSKFMLYTTASLILTASVLHTRIESELIEKCIQGCPESISNFLNIEIIDFDEKKIKEIPAGRLVKSSDYINTGTLLDSLIADKSTAVKASINIFDIIIFIVVALFLKLLAKMLQLSRIRQINREINNLLTALDSTRKTKNAIGLGSKEFSYKMNQETSTNPEDPQSITSKFVSILRKTKKNSDEMNNIFSLNMGVNLQVIFIFDELDKLTGNLDKTQDDSSGETSRDYQKFIENRNLQVHKILSDLKAVFATKYAKFIFIAGRNLYDEWLADQAGRHPLLDSIFTHHIYLPSFMVDTTIIPQASHDPFKNIVKIPNGNQLTARIYEFVDVHYHRSLNLLLERAPVYWGLDFNNEHSHLLRNVKYNPYFKLPRGYYGSMVNNRTAIENHFRRADLTQYENENPNRSPNSQNNNNDPNANVTYPLWAELVLFDDNSLKRNDNVDLNKHIIQCYIYYLTYRSKGAPKRLMDIMARDITSASVILRSSSMRGEITKWQTKFDKDGKMVEGILAEDALNFSDKNLYHYQLIADIYLKTIEKLSSFLINRDDRLAITAIYITDFILNFHNEAFSDNNIERIDELEYIHRDANIRDLIHKLLYIYQQTIMRPVLNGLFDYRFVGHFAKEIDYLSHEIPEELAIFNFTLNRSYKILENKRSEFERSKNTNMQSVDSLGDLHFQYQEYNMSIYYYEILINNLDKEFKETTGINGGVIAGVLSEDPKAYTNMQQYLQWGIGRLRYMLRIGLAFEIMKNYEMAEVWYADARQIQFALLKGYLRLFNNYSIHNNIDETPKTTLNIKTTNITETKETIETIESVELKDLPYRQVHILKHVNVIYQPIFARAWIAEKKGLSPDTAILLLENDINEIGKMLPFVRNFVKNYSDNFTEVNAITGRHASFALTMANMHNKTGDLYFFKGRGSIGDDIYQKWYKSNFSLRKTDEESIKCYFDNFGYQLYDGYLIRAQYHYSMSIHLVRSYIRYRKLTAHNKFLHNESENPLLGNDNMGEYINNMLSENLTNYSSTILSRLTLFGLVNELIYLDIGIAFVSDENNFFEEMKRWIEYDNSNSQDFIMDSNDGNLFSYGINMTRIEKSISNYTKANDWFGEVIEPSNEKPNYLQFGQRHHEFQKLIMSCETIRLSAYFLHKAGHNYAAADELTNAIETINQVLKSIQLMRLLDTNIHVKLNQNQNIIYMLDFICEFMNRIIDEMIKYCEIENPNKYNEYLIGKKISEKLAVQIMDFAFLYNRTQYNLDVFRLLLYKCEFILNLKQYKFEELYKYINCLLDDYLTIHRYPVLARLKAIECNIINKLFNLNYLTILQDNSLRVEIIDQIINFVAELRYFERKYRNSTYHSNYEIGVAYATVAIYFNNPKLDEKIKKDLIEILNDKNKQSHQDMDIFNNFSNLLYLAKGKLELSIAAYTMEAEYNNIIKDLYYFYDDFNEKSITRNKAIEMAGNNFAVFLLNKINKIINPQKTEPK